MRMTKPRPSSGRGVRFWEITPDCGFLCICRPWLPICDARAEALPSLPEHSRGREMYAAGAHL
jgi:hypothetical protein